MYEWIRQKYLGPLSAQLIDKIQEGKSEYLQKIKTATKDGKEPEPPLQEYYGGIRQFMDTPLLQTLLRLTVPKFALKRDMRSLRHFVDGYNFPLYAVWEQVQTDLSFKQSSMFSSAIPRVMQANYALTMRFLDELADRSGNPESVLAHEVTKKFIGKFEFKTYFQVHYMEVSKRVESIISAGTTEVVKFGKDIAPIISELFGSGMYVKDVAGKFVMLTVQILNRYLAHLQKLSSVAIGKTSAENCYKLIAEIMAVTEFVSSDLVTLVTERTKSSNKETNEKVRRLMDQLAGDLLQKLDKLLVPYVETLKYDVTMSILQNVDAVKSVVAMYRMTNKAFANQPSPYVASIFRPLTHLLAQPTFQKLSKVCRTSFEKTCRRSGTASWGRS